MRSARKELNADGSMAGSFRRPGRKAAPGEVGITGRAPAAGSVSGRSGGLSSVGRTGFTSRSGSLRSSGSGRFGPGVVCAVSYTHLRAHETRSNL
eukprot:3008993-Heterocapsa_arctica.AAC.1